MPKHPEARSRLLHYTFDRRIRQAELEPYRPTPRKTPEATLRP